MTQHLLQESHNHFSVDDLQSVQAYLALRYVRLEEYFAESLVHNVSEQFLIIYIFVDERVCHHIVVMACYILIYELCSLMENVSEHAVVDVLVVAVRLLHVCYVLEEEL